MFTFCLLTPGPNDHAFKASLLTFDNEQRILADPSWNGIDPKAARFMESHLQQTNAIIISHSTNEFISGYILLCITFPSIMSNIPVYSTLPVNQLGRISTVEYYRSSGILGPLLSNLVELDEIDNWFDKFNIVKYQQNVTICDRKITMTPYNSGHSLGGTFWLLVKKIDRIIYAPSWNHSKDAFLNSANFINATSGNPHLSLLRPTAFITATDLGSAMSHKKRCEKFLQLVDATLANGGSAVIPTSISGRFLEVFHLVDEHLKGAPIPVYFLSYSGTKILSYASSLMDWMSSGFSNTWNSDGGNNSLLPFNPSKVDLLLDPLELSKTPGSKIIFCAGLDLKNGDLSSKVFSYLCNDERTTVILTEKPPAAAATNSVENGMGLSTDLYHEWVRLSKERTGKVVDGTPVPLEKIINLNSWVQEEEANGPEAADFVKKITQKRKEKLMAKVRDQKRQNLLSTDVIDVEDSSDDDEEENDDETSAKVGEIFDEKVKQEKTHVPSTKEVDDLIQHEAFVMDNVKQNFENHLPIDIRVTHKLKPRQATFPFFPPKVTFDDYGQVIDAKDFERTDQISHNKIIMEGKRKFDEKKQKWNKNDKTDKKKNQQMSKLTPQEQVNQQLLQKYLDTLYKPMKRVQPGHRTSSSTQLRVRCGLAFVDLSGLVDLRSLGIIVQAIKPYNLILLPDERASDQSGLDQVEKFFEQQQNEQTVENTKKQIVNSSRYLSLSAIRDGLTTSTSPLSSGKLNVLVAHDDQPIKIGVDSENGVIGLRNFEINLDDAVVSTLKWQSVGDNYKVAKLYGELELINEQESSPEHNLHKKRKLLQDYINSNTQFSLKPLESEQALFKQSNANLLATTNDPKMLTMISNAPKLAIGNIRLPDLKKKLTSLNLNAEFKGEGTLVVDDALAIRKIAYGSLESDDSGDIVIDGNAGPLYYTVKECIKEMLAYV
ncbi:hypothetical protein KGF57_002732 [Candida theae]|uniref:Cleavage and polyadenylation specificity factor subunit 2 n=1 Tax=Candida theae TaxID=1198502 RepID=A0AAD5BFA9_9ASCO|nr:uncharacterized protein KGF57_002732 [Candida theae]KAI5958375.1 hypothetical protein KGF57_002732 [Candida theae]